MNLSDGQRVYQPKQNPPAVLQSPLQTNIMLKQRQSAAWIIFIYLLSMFHYDLKRLNNLFSITLWYEHNSAK